MGKYYAIVKDGYDDKDTYHFISSDGYDSKTKFIHDLHCNGYTVMHNRAYTEEEYKNI